MRAPIAALAFAGTLTAMTVSAQVFPPGAAPPSNATAPRTMPAPSRTLPTAASAAPVDSKVYPATATLPGPPPPDQLQPATIPLPNDAIEPYLLTAKNGPFMVMARAFRGPEAERYALALVLELRREYQLPAYILRTKDFPRLSNIRNIPPTAPAGVDRAHLADPERVRTYDEAVVLVGDEKTLKGSETLLHRVKKIKPKCLDGMSTLYFWREGLNKAMRTTNPFVPAQNLYPGKRDPMIASLNDGPRSILHCPGRYTLQVAEFSGRATLDVDGIRGFGDAALKKSPLLTAHEDAEKFAVALAKTPEIQKTGYQTYVYHDRTSSRVMIGAFGNPNDPNAVRLRENLVRAMVPIVYATKKSHKIDKMIAPASYLTDLEPIKAE